MGPSPSAGATAGSLAIPSDTLEAAGPALDTLQLEPLAVSLGSRTAPAVTVRTRALEVVGLDEVRRLPARTVPDLLRGWAGVHVQARSPAQTDLSLRGSSFEQVLVMVDGVPVSDAQSGHFDLDLAVPLDQVERVEILRGAASALHGADAMGGVVNVVTRSAGTGVRAGMEGGSFGRFRSWVGGGWGDAGDGGLRGSAGVELDRSDGHREGVEHETLQGRISLSAPAGSGRLRAAAGHARRDFGADAFYAPFTSYEETRTTTADLGWRGPVAGAWSGSARATFRRHDDDFILDRTDPGLSRNVHRTDRWGVEATARLAPAGSPLGVAAGVEATRDDLTSTNLGDRVEDRGAAFAELTWLDDRLSASAGLRLDAHEAFGPSLSPSVSAAWEVGPAFRIRGALGRSFRPPTFTERYYTDPANRGRADLDPETAWSAEVGVDASAGSAATARLTLFQRRSEGLIDWARPAGSAGEVPWETRNVESATFRGVEASVTAGLPGGFRARLAGALLSVEAEEAAGLESKYALRPRTRSATLQVDGTAGGGVRVLSRLRYGRRTDEDGHARLDVGARRAFGEVEVHLDVTNLLDRAVPDLTGRPAPGRAVTVGVAWTPGGEFPGPAG